MSDTGRKDLTSKAGETMKPDSQKSYAEQAKEKLTGATDQAAGAVQGDKSTTQKAADSGEKSYLEQGQEALGLKK